MHGRKPVDLTRSGKTYFWLLLVVLCAGCGGGGNADPIADDTVLEQLDCLDDTQDAEKARLRLALVQRALNPPERKAHGPIFPATGAVAELQLFLYPNGDKPGLHNGWCHDKFRDVDVRRTGPLVPIASRIDGEVAVKGLGTHAQVRVFYSDDVVRWLAGGREGAIPDGSMIVKEMYPGNKVVEQGDQPDGWAVMIRDSSASHDGWFWYLFYHSGNLAYGAPFESGQYGLSFCLACHASATGESTFAELDNLLGRNIVTYVELSGNPPGAPLVPPDDSSQDFGRGPHAHVPAIMAPDYPGDSGEEFCKKYRYCDEKTLFSNYAYNSLAVPRDEAQGPIFQLLKSAASDPEAYEAVTRENANELPMDAMYDHIPSSPGMRNEEPWVTASNCSGCHGTSDLLNATMPEMSVPLGDKVFDAIHLPGKGPLKPPIFAALSPYEEWSGSLMSVSSRDPVFRAQLESELDRFPQHAESTQNLCFSCHAPMGYRSDKTLADKLHHTYAIPDEADPLTNEREAGFGALARDGVSCAICHRMEADKFGEPESFNAQFVLGKPHEVYGPYGEADNLKTTPMLNAMGIEPKQGKHLADAGLCGSCHMVNTPVYDADTPDAPPGKHAHEQTTYMEWRNSDFAKGDQETCQDCHMGRTNPLAAEDGVDIRTRSAIANIEDTRFPHTPNRLDSEHIDVETRVGYRRHELTGINLFTLSMFQQFPKLVGSNTFYPTRVVGDPVSPTAFTMEAAKRMATQETAALELEQVNDTRFRVRVENKAGHKFPTGVGFRRAFLEFAVFDSSDELLWCSGCSTQAGVIVGADRNPLVVEFPRQSNVFEPHHLVISSEDQVQIYETRHVNRQGELTTSFLELDREVKDTRILPSGWSADLYQEFEMNPVGKPIPTPSNLEVTEYVLPDEITAERVKVRVRLLYQALPPYYLIDRTTLLGSDDVARPESQRLSHIVSRLDLATPSSAKAIEGWKLEIASAGLTLTP